MIAVVHLVWGPLGTAALRQFLASYLRHPAGSEHELVILLNGVQKSDRAAFEAELEDVEHHLIDLAEPVQDLRAYAYAAQRLTQDRLCFLNSYSAPLADDWLAKLDGALSQPGIGIVGASGSGASVRSGVLNSLFLPNPYRGVVPERAVARTEFIAIEREREEINARLGLELPASQASTAEDETPARRSLLGSVLATLRTFPPMPEQLIRFQGFPAFHLRTNAFLVDRRRFAGLRIGTVRRKMDAYALESGRASITRQIRRAGEEVLVVDRHGDSYDTGDWHSSRTFWQGDQEGLLVADNQTRMYSNGGIERRRLLSAFAWGTLADPAPPVKERVG